MTFDPEWLAVTRALHPYLSLAHHQTRLPPNSTELITRELEWVKRNVGTSGDGILDVEEVQKFVKTAPGVGDEGGDSVHPCTFLFVDSSPPARELTVSFR
jgi:lariat debranching enzyme